MCEILYDNLVSEYLQRTIELTPFCSNFFPYIYSIIFLHPISPNKKHWFLYTSASMFSWKIFFLGFFNPQYGPLLCLVQLVCLNWSSNVLRLSSCLYVFRLSKLTRIQIQMEEQQLCFLLLTSVLLCL